MFSLRNNSYFLIISTIVIASLLLTSMGKPLLAYDNSFYQLLLETPISGDVVKEEVKAIHITLITGDIVAVLVRNNSIEDVGVVKASSEALITFKGSNRYLVIPKNLITSGSLKKFDPLLFDITYLVKNRYYSLRYLPLIVSIKKPLNTLIVGVKTGETTSSTMLERVAEETRRIAEEIKNIVGEKAHVRAFDELGLISVSIPKDDLKSIKAFYDYAISSFEIDKIMLDHIRWIESTPFTGTLHVLSLDRARVIANVSRVHEELGYNGSGVRIAILDTGIDPTHPDFYFPNGTSKIIAAESFVDYNFDGIPDEDYIDMHGHGTHVASIAAGTGLASNGTFKGVAPGALLIAGKVLSNYGFGYDSWIINGIRWAVDQGARIISMSLGGTAYPGYDPLVDAVEAYTKLYNVIFVIAAGNEGPGYYTVSSPGTAPSAITVGAGYKDSLRLAYFSSWGPFWNITYPYLKPEIVAPGVNIAAARAIYTAMGWPYNYVYTNASGTSMATPFIAGVVALLLQKNPDLSVHEVKDILASTATPMQSYIGEAYNIPEYSDAFEVGAGYVNAYKALTTNFMVNPAIITLDLEPYLSVSEIISTPIYVLNNGTTSVNVSIDVVTIPYLKFYGYNLTQAITINAITMELAAKSLATINLTLNTTLIPPGYHTIRLLFKNTTSNELLGQAVIAVHKPQALLFRVYNFNGTNIAYTNEVAIIMLGLIPLVPEVESAPVWIYSTYMYNTSEVLVVPIPPGTLVTATVYAFLEKDGTFTDVLYLDTYKPPSNEPLVTINVLLNETKELTYEPIPGYDGYVRLSTWLYGNYELNISGQIIDGTNSIGLIYVAPNQYLQYISTYMKQPGISEKTYVHSLVGTVNEVDRTYVAVSLSKYNVNPMQVINGYLYNMVEIDAYSDIIDALPAVFTISNLTYTTSLSIEFEPIIQAIPVDVSLKLGVSKYLFNKLVSSDVEGWAQYIALSDRPTIVKLNVYTGTAINIGPTAFVNAVLGDGENFYSRLIYLAAHGDVVKAKLTPLGVESYIFERIWPLPWDPYRVYIQLYDAYTNEYLVQIGGNYYVEYEWFDTPVAYTWYEVLYNDTLFYMSPVYVWDFLSDYNRFWKPGNNTVIALKIITQNSKPITLDIPYRVESVFETRYINTTRNILWEASLAGPWRLEISRDNSIVYAEIPGYLGYGFTTPQLDIIEISSVLIIIDAIVDGSTTTTTLTPTISLDTNLMLYKINTSTNLPPNSRIIRLQLLYNGTITSTVNATEYGYEAIMGAEFNVNITLCWSGAVPVIKTIKLLDINNNPISEVEPGKLVRINVSILSNTYNGEALLVIRISDAHGDLVIEQHPINIMGAEVSKVIDVKVPVWAVKPIYIEAKVVPQP